MHSSVHQWFEGLASLSEFQHAVVLEIGAYDVNGSVKPFVVQRMPPDHYVGTDIRQGPNVDVLVDGARVAEEFGTEEFDVVICTEMLEHAQDWRAVIANIKAVLLPGGTVYLTTRSKGFPKHDFPGDYWRFSVDDMRAIFADFEIIDLRADPQDPGVFIKARKPEAHWHENAVDLRPIEVAAVE